MIDLRLLRDDPEAVREGLVRRGLGDAGATVDEVLRLDARRREAVGGGDELRARRNEVSRQIGELRKAGEDADSLIREMREVGERISRLEEAVQESEERIRTLLLETPNLPLSEVPAGGEDDAKVVRVRGERPSFSFPPLPHWDLGERLGVLDLPRGARVSGSGFPVLRGIGARLQRRLIDWMLDVHVQEHGYREVRVPYLVSEESMVGTGQLPKFEEESYRTERDGLWLIPTAEVPLTNLHRDELLNADDLPVRYTAYSPCFRREAGAAGADTRGMLRVHQFDKVELVRYETPERSRDALEELTSEAEVILKRLGLHYRVIRLAAGDLGFAGAMTYDLEVWAPGVERWLEVSSCTTFTDFQARRANLRYRPGGGEKPRHVHTLNGSALALPRLVVALLESGQEEDGAVRLPEEAAQAVGIERITPPGS